MVRPKTRLNLKSTVENKLDWSVAPDLAVIDKAIVEIDQIAANFVDLTTTSTTTAEPTTTDMTHTSSSNSSNTFGSGDMSESTTTEEPWWTTTPQSEIEFTTNNVVTNPPQSLNSRRPVEVFCGTRSMCIRVDRKFANHFWPHTRTENLRLSESCESFDLIAEDDSVTICLSHDDDYQNYDNDCGTLTEQNSTHVTFSNNITNSDSIMQIINPKISLSNPVNVNIISWRCVYPLNLVVKSELSENENFSENFEIHDSTGHGKFEISFFEKIESEEDDSLNLRLELIETFEDAR